MTTDTTPVDALRTRLARAFEVAALRDPGAELAAFEAAVRADERHEHGERIAKAIGNDVRMDAEGPYAAGVSDGAAWAAGIARDLSPAPEAKP